MLFTLGEAVKSGSNWQTILAWGRGRCKHVTRKTETNRDCVLLGATFEWIFLEN